MLFLFYRLVSYFALVLAPTLDVRVYIYTCIITCYTAPIPRDRLIITCLFVCLGGTSYKKKKKHCRVGIVSAYGVCRRGNFFSHPMHKVLKDRRRHHHRCTLCCMYIDLLTLSAYFRRLPTSYCNDYATVTNSTFSPPISIRLLLGVLLLS